MKKYCFLILIISKLLGQSNSYNIYEINKGEVLKNNYTYIQYLFDDLYSATVKKEGPTQSYFTELTGVIDINENQIVPYKYTNISRLWDHENRPNNSFIQVSNVAERKGVGLYEISDKINLNNILDGYLKLGYFVFKKTCIAAYSGYYDIINLKTGNIIKTNFIDIEPLTELTVATRDKTYKWGILDVNGNKVIENKYDVIRPLTDSLIIVGKNDTLGLVNSQGQFVIPCVFKHISTNGHMIYAQSYKNGKPLKLNEATKNQISDYTFSLSKSGEKTKKTYSVDLDKAIRTGLSGAFDKNGKVLIPFEYEIIGNGIDQNIIATKKNKYGILSTDGKNLVQHKYEKIECFYKKFYVLEINKKFGVLNGDLIEILPATYNKIVPISINEFIVLEGLQWFKINIDNDLKITKQKINYDASYDFKLFKINSKKTNSFGYCQDYFLVSKNGLYGVITKDLSILIPPKYQLTEWTFNTNYFEFQNNGFILFFGLNGNQFKDLDLSNSNYSQPLENAIICKKDGKYGVIDSQGNVVVPFNYFEIKNIDGRRFIVKK
ncbi:MAG: WG repeat-containing protein [Sphingobacteriaceae bacterium]